MYISTNNKSLKTEAFIVFNLLLNDILHLRPVIRGDKLTVEWYSKRHSRRIEYNILSVVVSQSFLNLWKGDIVFPDYIICDTW